MTTHPANSSRSRTWSAVPDGGLGGGRGGVPERPRPPQQPRTWRWCRCGRCPTARRPRPRRRPTGGVPWPCCTTGRPWTRWDRTGTRRASSDRRRPGRRTPWPRGPCWTRPRCRSGRRSWLGSGTSSPCRRSSARYLIGSSRHCNIIISCSRGAAGPAAAGGGGAVLV